MTFQYIGINASCSKNCAYTYKQSFQCDKHDHEVLSIKQCRKLIEAKKICQISQLSEKYIRLINQQTEKLIDDIMKNQIQAIQKIKRSFYRIVLPGSKELTQRELFVFQKLSHNQFNQLKCSEVHNLLVGPPKKFQLSETEEQASLILSGYKDNLIEVVTSNFLDIERNENSLREFQRSIISASQDQKNFHDMSFQGDNKLVDESSEISVNFGENSSNFQLANENKNNIELLMKKLDHQEFSTYSEHTLKSKGEIFFDKKPEPFEIMSLSVIKNQKKQARAKTKGVSQLSTEVDFGSLSFVKKNQGKYYIPVQYLKKQQYKRQKSIFNLRLKVVKQLFFRLYQDEKSGKTHKKVKFIAGDQTGIVVCYTNYIPEISQGKYITLNDCGLTKFYNTSYEVTSIKCRPSYEGQNFEVNLQNRISAFENKETLTYIIQKFDSFWPSVGCLSLLASSNWKKIQIIAKVEQFLYESDNRFICFLSDGTGKIYAQIKKIEGRQLSQGKVFYFTNLQVILKKPQNIICAQTNSLVLKSEEEKLLPYYGQVDQFKYD